MRYAIILLVLIGMAGCKDDPIPKPRAYARIDLPEPTYLLTEGEAWTCPFTFEYSQYSAITVDPRYRNKSCWYNLYYPRYRATVHLTYTEVADDLAVHIEDSRKLAMKHIAKAAQIEEAVINDETNRVYGVVYDFKGETASDMQFFLTDSTDHFLRGALYFTVSPNKDSLAPVIGYIKKDIGKLISSFRWRSTGTSDGNTAKSE